jgi:alanyl-tRNA synthetase
MTSAEIRQSFLDYFATNGHAALPSSSLVPADDPTLLFTNAGMVQFKRVFLGEEKLGTARAATSQKCLRVSGKHNDLEEVGVTPRHHTFFEMLGNFSFGDYFKRDAIRFAWELLTDVYKLPKNRLWATVHHSDDEAAQLWQEIAGLPASRIIRLGDKDNFWQMAETGPCGPCSEIHYDLRAESDITTDLTTAEFVACTDRTEILEFWNLVFMQFDRQADGELQPLPKPSIDTGMGLERLAMLLQGVRTNYETDLFTPLIERAAAIVGRTYDPGAADAVSYRVLADHARAVAFLLADGVFPSNEGRGYVLRRILRRAVRHAWLLGRREPTLVHVVDKVIDVMGRAFPQLSERREHLVRSTRTEEERFLSTIDTGMSRFDDFAPLLPDSQRAAADRGTVPRPVLSGEAAFKLHDTFGFPLDLTEIIARERGYDVDVEGFGVELEAQRARSRLDRKTTGTAAGADQLAEGWEDIEEAAEQEFVGYQTTDIDTDVVAFRRENGRLAVQLRQNPFYAESGGQVSDRGVVEGDGWRLLVDDVRRVAGRVAVLGDIDGGFNPLSRPLRVHASVAERTRRDTERNHTATHLLHAALRKVLGTHVVQRGSLVAPERLRFDFSHPRPVAPDELRQVEEEVNRAVLANEDVRQDYLGYPEAVARGAMALFGEKYGDVVRMVSIPGVSMELCGGTHVRHTGEIGLFRIVQETGIASGVRRIEAITGSVGYQHAVEQEQLLRTIATTLKTAPDNVLRRVQQLVEENRDLQRQLEGTRVRGTNDLVTQLLQDVQAVDGLRIIAREVEVKTIEELRTLGDRVRAQLGSGAAVLGARVGDRGALLAVATDDLVKRGMRADKLVKAVAELTGGSGGGKPQIAQAGVGDIGRMAAALAQAPDIARRLLGGHE